MAENAMTVPTITERTTGTTQQSTASTAGSANSTTSTTNRTGTRRSTWRSVAVPTEHGGWGLTLEPGLLGLLVAPGMAALWLALAAMVAFTARTPLKIVAVDIRRKRVLDRTRLAAVIGLAELAVLAVLMGAALSAASHPFWWPLVVATPLVALEGVYGIRSRSRRLAPELAGAVGVCAVAAMAVAADGGSTTLAAGVWLILGGRAITSVPWVRGQIVRIHNHSPNHKMLVLSDAVALGFGATAVLLEPSLVPGALALPVLIAIQRTAAMGEPVSPAVQGVIQMFMGFGIVAATAIGVAVL